MSNNIKKVETKLKSDYINNFNMEIRGPADVMSFQNSFLNTNKEYVCFLNIGVNKMVFGFDITKPENAIDSFKLVFTNAILKNTHAIILISNSENHELLDEIHNLFYFAAERLHINFEEHIKNNVSMFLENNLDNVYLPSDYIPITSGVAPYNQSENTIELEYLTDEKYNSSFDSFIASKIYNKDKEHIIVANFDENDTPINYSLIGIGSRNEAFIKPESVYKAALLCNASKVKLYHNHPGGSIEPSQPDYTLFERLYDCGRLLGVEFYDALIVGSKSKDNIYSFRSSGDMEKYINKESLLTKESKSIVSEKGRSMITIKDFLEIQKDDIDVADDYDERCYICYCPDEEITLSEEALDNFNTALNCSIDIYPDIGIIHCNDSKQAENCKELFEALAGYCSIRDYDRWFIPKDLGKTESRSR